MILNLHASVGTREVRQMCLRRGWTQLTGISLCVSCSLNHDSWVVSHFSSFSQCFTLLLFLDVEIKTRRLRGVKFPRLAFSGVELVDSKISRVMVLICVDILYAYIR